MASNLLTPLLREYIAIAQAITYRSLLSFKFWRYFGKCVTHFGLSVLLRTQVLILWNCGSCEGLQLFLLVDLVSLFGSFEDVSLFMLGFYLFCTCKSIFFPWLASDLPPLSRMLQMMFESFSKHVDVFTICNSFLCCQCGGEWANFGRILISEGVINCNRFITILVVL